MFQHNRASLTIYNSGVVFLENMTMKTVGFKVVYESGPDHCAYTSLCNMNVSYHALKCRFLFLINKQLGPSGDHIQAYSSNS